MPISNERLIYFQDAIAAGARAAGANVDGWTDRDQLIAETSALEALEAWLRVARGGTAGM